MIPSLTELNPFAVPWQGKALIDIRKVYNYSQGVHEVLLSGSVGSAKSVLLAHLVVTHCLFNKGARVLVARRSMPDLKDTIWNEILDHIDGVLIEGKDYTYNRSRTSLKFANGSEIITRSWADGKIRKFRSLILSMAVIEELTESEDGEFYKEIKMRVGRIPNIKEKLVVCATNPDSPSHWAYKYFIDNQNEKRHVYYSITDDNPFLPASYVEGIRETLSPREARRMLQGEWLELSQEVVYYNYTKENNYIDHEYTWSASHPRDIMFDFNIGAGKPMSAAVGQYIDSVFHVAKTYIIHGARTLDIMEEMFIDGFFDSSSMYRVFGDAAGKHRDTRSIRSDYDIIEDYVKKLSIRYQMRVPKSNGAIRERHNKMNAVFKNDLKEVRFFVYKEAKPLDEGLRLTKLKKGANYIEDDSFEFQHVTTAVGYWVVYLLKMVSNNIQIHSQRR